MERTWDPNVISSPPNFVIDDDDDDDWNLRTLLKFSEIKLFLTQDFHVLGGWYLGLVVTQGFLFLVLYRGGRIPIQAKRFGGSLLAFGLHWLP